MKPLPILIKLMLIFATFWFCKLFFIERLISGNLKMGLDSVTFSGFFSCFYNFFFFIFNS